MWQRYLFTHTDGDDGENSAGKKKKKKKKKKGRKLTTWWRKALFHTAVLRKFHSWRVYCVFKPLTVTHLSVWWGVFCFPSSQMSDWSPICAHLWVIPKWSIPHRTGVWIPRLTGWVRREHTQTHTSVSVRLLSEILLELVIGLSLK